MPKSVEGVTEDLPEEVQERVLEGLGFIGRPEPDLAGLRAVYGAWCRRVPFDNVRKLIHLRSGRSGPLPGSSAADFFEGWLTDGTGGTCWAGAGALHALLGSLGLAAARWVGTMLAAPDLPPNHGSVVVTVGEARYLVDTSMLHGEPLPLEERVETSVVHPAWGVRCHRREGRWHVRWRPLNRPEGFECRLESPAAGAASFRSRHEQTRGWGPFNYEVSARLNRDQGVIGLAFGDAVSLRGEWGVTRRPVSHEERVALLTQELGMSEALVRHLPPDQPTPPPPGSRASPALEA